MRFRLGADEHSVAVGRFVTRARKGRRKNDLLKGAPIYICQTVASS